MEATYYDVVSKLSSFAAMWPYLESKTRSVRMTLLTVTTLTVLLPEIAQQYVCKIDLQCTTQNMSSSLVPIMFLIMLYTSRWNNQAITVLTRHLFVDWKELNDPEELEIIKSYAEDTRRFSLVYSVFCIVSLFLFLSLSLTPHVLDILLPLNESRPIFLPYPANYFVDPRVHFFKIYWHSIFAWGIIMTGVIAHDCMYVAYIKHICGIFATIGFRMERLFHDDHNEKERTFDPQHDVFCEKIALITDTHQTAIELAQLLEKLNVPYAVQTLIAPLGISITLLQITKRNDSILETVKYILYVCGQLIHLFISNFEGQRLIDHSLQMRDKIYHSYWYKVSAKSQKLILMVMMKSLRPCCLSAGKIYVFSVESFATILQASMSYFTVLASFQ